LNNSAKIRISLEDEIHYLQSYTTLENLRFNDRITVQILIDEAVDVSAIAIPPMLIQPFVENTFVHAFNSKSLNPQLQISFQLESDFLVCEIKDNGKGMSASKNNELSQSRGIQLVRERLSLLQVDANFALTVSSVPNQGTTVLIRIKLG
jgi:sensor histidine kinase YesM